MAVFALCVLVAVAVVFIVNVFVSGKDNWWN